MSKKIIVVFSVSVLVIFSAFLAVKAAPSITSTLTFSGVTNDIQTTGNDNLSIMPGGTGNVGVGTTDPQYKLDVNGDIRSGASAILTTGGGAGYYQDVTNGAYRSIVSAGTTNGYFFQTNGGGATTMYIGLGGTYNGSVGIGTQEPAEKLDVNGNIAIQGKRAFLGYDSWLRINEGSYFTSGIYAGSGIFRTDGNFQVGGSGSLFTVLPTGGVGIGNIAPSYALDVTGQYGAKMAHFTAPGAANLFLYGDAGGTGITNTDPYTGGALVYLTGNDTLVYSGSVRPLTINASGISLVSSAATSILAGGKRIGDMDVPLASTDAATKGYVDGAIVASAGSVNFVSRQPDGDRIASNILPTTSPHGVRFDFVAASTVGAGGNYAGVMTFAPWAGTSVSTGDASYQFAFGSSATNGSGVPQLNIRNGIDSTWNSWRKVITDDGAGNILVSGNIMRTTHSNGFLLGSYNNVGSNDGKSNPIYTIGSNYMPGDVSLGNMYGIGYSHSNFWGAGKSTGWGLYTAEAGVIHNTISDGGIWTAGSISAVGNIYPNNQTTYGLIGNDVYADTINTGVAGDQLEVNYHTAGPVKICSTAACATYSAFFGTNGRVGIGTDSPGTSLDVNGSIRGISDSSYFSFDSGADRIGFVKKSGYVGKLAYGSGNSFAITQSNAATIVPGSTFTDRFVLDSTGNVDITGTGSVEKLRINGTSQANLTLNGTLGQIQNSAGALYITNDAATDIIFRSSASTENMRIASDGNVSIARGNLAISTGSLAISTGGLTLSSGNIGVRTSASLSGLSVGTAGAANVAIYGDAVGFGATYGVFGNGLYGIRGQGAVSGSGAGGYFSGGSYGITTTSCSGCSVLAEMVPVAETPNNGDIMCMNPLSGKVEICREDKSNRLKGIAQKMAETVMRMGCSKTLAVKNGENSVNIGVMDVDAWQKDPACKGWYPIALSGLSEQTNVVCKTPNGKPLQYGDILVSSVIPGHLRPLDEGETVAAYQIAGKSDSICSPGKEKDSIMVWIQ